MPTQQTESTPSFLLVYTQVLRDRMKHSFLRQISACVDWRGIRTLLNKKYTKTQNATGSPAYDALMMFKILLLQTWYGLSDCEVEEWIDVATDTKNVLTDGQGLVESVITTPANCANTVVLPKLIEKAELTQGVSVLADKGYCSKKNSACLLERGLIDGIMLKAQKGMKLTERQREFNNLISKTRCLIERTFGSIRRWFSGGRCRYRGLERTHTQNVLEAMAYNLKRMPGLLVLQSTK